jgi:hypothetical protein
MTMTVDDLLPSLATKPGNAIVVLAETAHGARTRPASACRAETLTGSTPRASPKRGQRASRVSVDLKASVAEPV